MALKPLPYTPAESVAVAVNEYEPSASADVTMSKVPLEVVVPEPTRVLPPLSKISTVVPGSAVPDTSTWA